MCYLAYGLEVCRERGSMAEYRRFIAYVYEYQNGKKGNGKGFIKVESRDGICRMQYKLLGVCADTAVPAKIYGYVRKEGSCEGILLGECDLSGGNIQFEQETKTQNMGGSPYSLEQLSGLIIVSESGIFYGSGWDDKPVLFQKILLPKEEIMQADAKEIPEESHSEREKEDEVKTEEIEQDEKPEMAEEEENLEESHESHMEKQGQEFQEKVQDSQVSEQSVEQSQEPVIFPDNTFCDCRKITPSDFKMLSRRDQGLLYNNFLRHGFSKHGSVILARREEDDRYILGVPGYYERQEVLMANMFGFPYFKETGGDRNKAQRFGYWYRFIEHPNME